MHVRITLKKLREIYFYLDKPYFICDKLKYNKIVQLKDFRLL